MKKLLIVTQRLMHKGPRIIREIDALEHHFEIHTIGLSKPHKEPASHSGRERLLEPFAGRLSRFLNRRLLGRFTQKSYVYGRKLREIKAILQGIRPDVIICHEPYDLPYFVALKPEFGFKLVFNAHEYYPLEFNDKPGWAQTWQLYYEDIYRRALPSVDLMINVCESIREKCLEVFQQDSLVIPNAAAYHDLQPHQPGEIIRIIHHGAAIPSRKIERMIEVAALLGEGYSLDLMLQPNDQAYYNSLLAQTAGLKQVRLIEPVAFHEIVPVTNRYDIGIFLLPPTNYNYSVALPNKLFEFIQGRVAVAIGPSPEMARIVKKYDLGVISDDFTPEDLANRIGALDRETLFRYKQNAHRAATDLSAEHYNALMLERFLQLTR